MTYPETDAETTGPAERATSPLSTKVAKNRDVGLLALIGIAVCCGLPVLVGAGALAAAGGLLRSWWPVLAAVVIAIGSLAYTARRHASSKACRPATPSPSPPARRR